MKVMCDNSSCKFCCMGETVYDSHCCADDNIALSVHWVDDDQTLVNCTTYEPRGDEESG